MFDSFERIKVKKDLNVVGLAEGKDLSNRIAHKADYLIWKSAKVDLKAFQSEGWRNSNPFESPGIKSDLTLRSHKLWGSYD